MCEITGLSPATITNLVSKLTEEQLVYEVGTEHPQSADGGGRPTILLDINPAGAYVMGIHIGVRSIGGVVGDLRGRILAHQVLPRRREVGPKGSLRAAADLGRQLLDATPIDRSRLLGAGVAVVGVVDPVDGVVRHAPQLDWEDVPVRRILESDLGMSVVVDNSSRAMTVSEALLGVARAARNVVLVHIGTVIGSGLLLEHRLFYGDSNGAGQLGHIMVQPNGPRCVCGSYGCLNAVASEWAIVAQMVELMANGHKTMLRDLAEGHEQIEPSTIYTAALRGDRAAQGVIADAGRALGAALVQACILLDPELIIVTGQIQEVGRCFFQPLCETVEPHLVKVLGRAPRIVPGSFGTQSALVGAVALGLARFFYRTGLDLELAEKFTEAGSSLAFGT